jgi:hypothetical protein
MDARTAEALEASIQHWRENVEAVSFDDTAIGPTACALCQIFWTKPREQQCVGCPVMMKTGKMGCVSTPYEIAEEAWEEWEDVAVTYLESTSPQQRNDAKSAFLIAARAELAFLESLRETR